MRYRAQAKTAAMGSRLPDRILKRVRHSVALWGEEEVKRDF